MYRYRTRGTRCADESYPAFDLSRIRDSYLSGGGGAVAVAVHRAVRYGPSTSAPQYMTDCCIHTSGIARRQHLRSAGCHQLFVPRHRRSMFGRRASSVAGRLPVTRYQTTYLRDPSRSFDTFLRDLKNFSLRLFAI